jgi:zinc protease
MERVGGFGGKANQLNAYYKAAGTPDYFQKDLDRYRAVTAAGIKAAVEKYLPKDRRVELSVVPGENK